MNVILLPGTAVAVEDARHAPSSREIIPVSIPSPTDESSGILEIRFRDNKTLQYLGVPPRIFRDFLQVVSKGRFYDGVIKGKFTERRRA